MKKFLLVTFMLIASFVSWGQQITITGKVTAGDSPEGLPGVNIVVKGTTVGTTTDADGSYAIQVSDGNNILVFSFIGFETEERTVGAQTNINVLLTPNIQTLSEVVVIGYGEREKKDITGAISNVSSKDIAKSAPLTPELAMQGRMSGVFVSTPSGTPFDRPTVRIRGVSTFGVADPLYVIDGVPVFEGGSEGIGQASRGDLRSPINILAAINPNDIESISVLKDASAAAVYGVRAANGVVLITTKKGAKGTPKIDFSMREGIQSLASKPLAVLNTQQYTALMNEMHDNRNALPSPPGNLANAGGVNRDRELIDAPNPVDGINYYLGNNPTYDWQDAVQNKDSRIRDYSVGIGGGNDAATYYIGAGYGKQEGVFKGNELERYSLSMNLTLKASKYVEGGITYKGSYVQATDNSSTGTSLTGTYRNPPWQPIYDPNGPYGYAVPGENYFTLNKLYNKIPNPAYLFNPATDPNRLLDTLSVIMVNPQPYMNKNSNPPGAGYGWGNNNGHKSYYGRGAAGNQLGFLTLDDNSYEIFRNLGSAYIQLQPIEGLRFKATISGDIVFNFRKNWNAVGDYIFGNATSSGNPFAIPNTVGTFTTRETKNYNLTQEFAINYNKSFGDHNIDILLNAMNQKFKWEYGSMESRQIFFEGEDLRGVPEVVDNPSYKGSFLGKEHQALIGYLGRVSYKFKDKYYVDVTIRRDGSSKFSERWGTFPAFALAWRISQESFMQGASNFLSDLKLRGGYGVLGNSETTLGYAFLPRLFGAPKYATGPDPGLRVLGRRPAFATTAITWERAATTSAGFDAAFLDNSITLSAEYYRRDTEDIIQNIMLPPTIGENTPVDLNVATVRNSGVEINLGYQKQIGDIIFGISGNITTTKNRVIKINGGAPFTNPRTNNRIEEGKPMDYIFGYKVGGIFQTQEEVDAWRALYNDAINGGNSQNFKRPGDLYFQDLGGTPVPGTFLNTTPDGIINSNDQVYLGKTIPGYYYGITLNVGFKGIDLSAMFQGIGDVQKLNTFRRDGESMSALMNNQLATTMNRWTPENTNTSMPRPAFEDQVRNARQSDRWVEDAGFMRLRNIQLGYSLPSSMLQKTGVFSNLRIYIMGSNLFTVTNWKGVDPENDGMPPAKVLGGGLNVTF